MENMQLVKAKKYRTTKEKIYLVLSALVSLLIFGGLVFLIVSTVKTSLEPNLMSGCFLRDSELGSVLAIDRIKLQSGEVCLNWNELTLAEKSYFAEPICFYRSEKTSEVIGVDQRLLSEGTSCLRWNNLSPKEAESLINPSSRTWVIIATILSSLILPIYILAVILFILFSHFLSLGYIRMNGIKIGPNQFTKLWEKANALGVNLGMKTQPDIFVINGNGVLNAFATKLVLKRVIVMYSDLAEVLMESDDTKQIEAVLSHELGHHALGHTQWINLLIFPAQCMPFLGKALSRAREYSADRIMLALVPDMKVGQRALIKLAGGKVWGSLANIDIFIGQIHEERGFFVWLAEVFSTHPHLVKRMHGLKMWSEKK